jgi:hypothetical protein
MPRSSDEYIVPWEGADESFAAMMPRRVESDRNLPRRNEESQKRPHYCDDLLHSGSAHAVPWTRNVSRSPGWTCGGRRSSSLYRRKRRKSPASTACRPIVDVANPRTCLRCSR